MTCKEFREILSAGNDLPPEAQDHLKECAGCSAMMSALNAPGEASLDTRSLRELTTRLTDSLAPARVLPSDATLRILLFGFFAAFSLLMTVPFGFFGFEALSIGQKITYYGLLGALGLFLSIVIVKELIPGSRRFLRASLLLTIPLLLLVGTTIILFQNFDATEFVELGIPCLRLGLISAVVCGGFSSLILKIGYVTAPVRAGALLGGLAGVAGFAVLALHCPFLSSAHILTWHLGAAILATLAGILTGYLCRYGAPFRKRPPHRN
jgi:hypothetical protein